jgi:hypothetical protein
MSLTKVTPTAHFLILLMSARGRSLACEECKLCFDFPAGASYKTVAKQFPCQIVGPSKDDAS